MSLPTALILNFRRLMMNCKHETYLPFCEKPLCNCDTAPVTSDEVLYKFGGGQLIQTYVGDYILYGYAAAASCRTRVSRSEFSTSCTIPAIFFPFFQNFSVICVRFANCINNIAATMPMAPWIRLPGTLNAAARPLPNRSAE